jgi:hypothetical protein
MKTDPQSHGHILLVLYDGSYGRTLRIDLQSARHAAFVEDVLIRLAKEDIREVELPGAEEMRLEGLRKLKLTLPGVGSNPSSDSIEEDRASGVVSWIAPASSWERCHELSAALSSSSGPGHQYLTREGEDSILVELAYLEPRPRQYQA